MSARPFLCRLGWHREYRVADFRGGTQMVRIIGVQCERCGRFRCVAPNIQLLGPAADPAFDEARAWLEKQTGARVIGPFVRFR